MNILFLTLSQIISEISNRGIYPDLLREFAKKNHNIFIVCPFERKLKKETCLTSNGNVHILGVKTLNNTKSNILEKGIGTILIEYQYHKAIKKHLSAFQFDLVIYSTPPITLLKVIQSVKKKYGSKSYLLLKDIFPQNAVDLGILSKWNPIYWYFLRKEKRLYRISDIIGCMSPANVDYIIKNNAFLDKVKVEVCPNSIEIQSRINTVTRESIRDEYCLPREQTIFIYGGNLGKSQGIDFLIEVLQDNKNREDAFFVIAGSGTEVYKLKYFFQNEKPQNALLLPQTSREKFDELLSVCDIGLIFLDKRYTIPNYPSRLLNYLEFKKPVLMAIDKNTDVGRIAEENGYGFWVESSDIKKFTEKLNLMINNKELQRSMGNKGYDYLCNNYTVDTSYDIIMGNFLQ